MLGVLREAKTRRYLLGQVLSLFGDTSLWLALGIWVKSLSHSNSLAGAVTLAFVAPQILGPFSAILVDRRDRRRLLLDLNIVAAAVVLALMFVGGPGQIWLIFVVMGAYGLLYPLLSAAQVALLQEAVPPGGLASANALLRTAQEGSRLIGPLLGAGLFGVVGGRVVAVLDAATFLIAAVSLALLRVPTSSVQVSPVGYGVAGHCRELMAGFAFVLRNSAIRAIVGGVVAVMLTAGFTESALFAVVGTGLGKSPEFLGVLAAAQGVGAIVGGIASPPVLKRWAPHYVVAAAMLLLAGGCALLTSSRVGLALLGSAVAGIGAVLMIVCLGTILQTHAPVSIMGRVSAAVEGGITAAQIFSISLGVVLIRSLSYRALLFSVAAVCVFTAVIVLSQARMFGELLGQHHRHSGNTDAASEA